VHVADGFRFVEHRHNDRKNRPYLLLRIHNCR
jgi:hypothetical protein